LIGIFLALFKVVHHFLEDCFEQLFNEPAADAARGAGCVGRARIVGVSELLGVPWSEAVLALDVLNLLSNYCNWLTGDIFPCYSHISNEWLVNIKFFL